MQRIPYWRIPPAYSPPCEFPPVNHPRLILPYSFAGCLTELCVSDFYSIFFSFRHSLIFQIRHQFTAFSQVAFQADENPPAWTNYQTSLYKSNLMCEELSYQIIDTQVVNQAVFCYYQKFSKIIIENISVAGCEQRRYALF